MDPVMGPIYREHHIDGNRVVVSFDHVGAGLKSRDGEALGRFEVAGPDRTWHWATATIGERGEQVIVTSEDVEEPVAVRYAIRFAFSPFFDEIFEFFV